MSLGLDLLDEIDYAQGPLIRTAKPPVAIEQAIPVSGSSCSSAWRSPYFTRALGPADSRGAWLPFCSLLRRHGIAMFSPSEALAEIPAASAPARWSGRATGEPFDFDELASAELFEITCFDRVRRQWKWPSEVASDRINGLLRSVRAVSRSDAPIGVSLPLGCHRDDLRLCQSADVDFISLSCRFANFEASDLHSLVQCRRLAVQLGRPQLPILVTAPVVNFSQAHKLLALGASAVSLDEILRPALARDRQRNDAEDSAANLRSMLPSIPASFSLGANKQANLPEVEQLLARSPELLGERLASVGASDLRGFTHDCLRSVSERAERVTGVKRLEHSQAVDGMVDQPLS